MVDVFDPIAILRALDQRRVTYIVIGALGRVIQGSDEVTDGSDIVPSTREENLRKLGLALADLNARRVDIGLTHLEVTTRIGAPVAVSLVREAHDSVDDAAWTAWAAREPVAA